MTERESEFYDLYYTLISYKEPQLYEMKDCILHRLKALNADVTDFFANSRADVIVCKDRLQSWFALNHPTKDRDRKMQLDSFKMWLLH